jgi:hypothetical protein
LWIPLWKEHIEGRDCSIKVIHPAQVLHLIPRISVGIKILRDRLQLGEATKVEVLKGLCVPAAVFRIP